MYLIIEVNGRRGWYWSEERVVTASHEIVYKPLFFDDKWKPVSLDFALDARARWRQMGYDVYIVRDRYDTDFVGEDYDQPSTGQDNREPVFVHTVGGDFGYWVHAAVTPNDGRCWCLKFSNPTLAAQSVFAATPEATISKARDLGFLQIEPPQPSPIKAQQEAERRRIEQEQRNSSPVTFLIRPGDRRQ